MKKIDACNSTSSGGCRGEIMSEVKMDCDEVKEISFFSVYSLIPMHFHVVVTYSQSVFPPLY